jgi:hypothetical protein
MHATCMHLITEDSGIVGLPRPDHLIFSRATRRVVGGATCDARRSLSNDRVKQYLLETDKSDLIAAFMHPIMITIN